jgi:hypothetical protein
VEREEFEESGFAANLLGVDRIAGEKLDFGGVAHAIPAKSDASVLLVADGGPAPRG